MFKYFLVGFIFWGVGALFFGSSMAFQGRSDPAMLLVTEMQSRRDHEGWLQYRPVLALADAPEPREDYVGNIWVAPKPHERGDVVPGRYDPETGEMRTDKMMERSVWIGRMAQILGALLALQGVAMLFGVPEERLPLKVTIGHRRRRRRLLLWD